ncbi:MAG TPA: BON domain-containing protein [Gammaproteobacteria bacterium]|nr:BON domain-containing protein [Gammaproteobacteria bacterium]
MDDASKTAAAIRAALERDTDINLHAYPIDIRAENGTLRLEGAVGNIIAKRKALRLARAAAHSDEIIDDLYVGAAGEHGDGETAVRILDALQRENAFEELHIGTGDDADLHVSVANGRVTLTGTMPSLSHRRLAEVLCWWVPGCRDVHNRLHVEPAEHDHDGEITDAIRLALDKEPGLDGVEIRVRTTHAEVTLTGRVASESLGRIAVYDCWYVPGVHAVHNRLEIRPD